VCNKVERINIKSKQCCYPDVNYEQFWKRQRLLYRFTKFSLPLVKGKAIPLQAWTGPEGSRRLRLPDFMTIGT
jgi:hypothetical protein